MTFRDPTEAEIWALVYYSGPPAEEELDQKSADIDICK